MLKIRRVSDVDIVRDVMRPYIEELRGFEPETWLLNSSNVCLLVGNDISFFEYEGEGVYTGHLFFESRGRKALDSGRLLLSHFVSTYKPFGIRGLTPAEYKGARWINRQLGFKSFGLLDIDNEVYELFIMQFNKGSSE